LKSVLSAGTRIFTMRLVDL